MGGDAAKVMGPPTTVKPDTGISSGCSVCVHLIATTSLVRVADGFSTGLGTSGGREGRRRSGGKGGEEGEEECVPGHWSSDHTATTIIHSCMWNTILVHICIQLCSMM